MTQNQYTVNAHRKLSSKSSKSGSSKSSKSKSSGHGEVHVIYLDENRKANEAKQDDIVYIWEEERSNGKSGKSSKTGTTTYLRVVAKPKITNSTANNSTNSSSISGSTKSLLSLSTLGSPATRPLSWLGLAAAITSAMLM